MIKPSANPLQKILEFQPSRWTAAVFVAILLGTMATLSLVESYHESPVIDEIAQIPAGISYVQTGTPRINRESPPLVKYLAGLSAELATHPQLNTHLTGYQTANEWQFGEQFLYQTPGNQPNRIVFWARLPVLLVTIGLGLVIYGWTSRLFGRLTALVILALFCFDPTIIAYSHLVTFDLPMAALVAASAFAVWLGLTRNQRHWFVVAGVALGLALSMKVTAVMYALLLPAMLLPFIRGAAITTRQRVQWYASRLALLYGPAIITIDTVYMVVFGPQAWHPFLFLPTDFLYDIWFGLFRYSQTVPSFILGHMYASGHWWYIPVSFLLKAPLPFIGLVAMGGVLGATRAGGRTTVYAFSFLPIIVFGVVTFSSTLNLGLRYAFIVYPFGFVVVGLAVRQLMGWCPAKAVRGYVVLGVGIATLVYYITNLVAFFPNYFTYANQLAGGKAMGYHNLADSNIDWGQGLLALQYYANNNHLHHLPIVYYGRANPRFYGFKPVLIITSTHDPALATPLPTVHGPLAVSVTAANFLGLSQHGYKIDGRAPQRLVAGSILLYQLP